MMSESQLTTRKRWRVLLGILILLVGAGIGLVVWQTGFPVGTIFAQATATTTSPYQTTSVRRGVLAVSISGSGTVVASQTVDLAFGAAGEVKELNVQVGDQVIQGQVLARLGNLDELELAVENQELAVWNVQNTLDDLLSGGAAVLAQSQADAASAEAAYADAQKNLHLPGDPRCMPGKTQEYYFAYLYAQQRVDEWEGYLTDPDTGYGRDYIFEKLAPMRKDRDLAYINMTYCQGYTEQEIRDSQANLELAKAELDQANANYQSLKSSQGVDVQAVEIAQAELENARLQLNKAQKNLAGATINAPIEGTVMAINGAAGETVGTGVFITLAVLDDPDIQVNIDENDLVNFAEGCSAQVTFDSLPGEIFDGVVSQVSPALVNIGEVGMVQGLVDLEKTTSANGRTLPLNLTASVEVTCQQANDALFVPAQALYKEAGQPVYVYVLDDQGQPRKREVVVGIETIASAEIINGLEEGEQVIISAVEEL